jgi:hypothetical protein
LEKHLARAEFIGVRYLVIISPWIKEQLNHAAAVSQRHDFGAWSVFEIKRQPLAEGTRTLSYRPALVISSFSFKGRNSDDFSFVRLAEEQFADAWFDVLLASSPEPRIDRLADLEQFGAVIIERYSYEDEQRAYDVLLGYAKTHALVLISDNDNLFNKIEATKNEFPNLYIIPRPKEKSSHFLDSERPTTQYGQSATRATWYEIKQALEQNKIAAASATNVPPILVNMTYHPNWKQLDGKQTYPVTTFFTLVFGRPMTSLAYSRRKLEKSALILSFTSFIVVLSVIIPALPRYWPPVFKRLRNSKQLRPKYDQETKAGDERQASIQK